MLQQEAIYGQNSWLLASDSVQMAVTHKGAQMAPVLFRSQLGRPIQPYHISPWQQEPSQVPDGASEAILRGDFLCLPFGYAEPELSMHAHGRAAGQLWKLERVSEQNGLHCLQIGMEHALRAARLTRRYLLRDGENVVYSLDAVQDLGGRYTIGHHPVLRTPRSPQALLVSTSPLRFGMSFPKPFTTPGSDERQALAIAATFDNTAQVPAFEGNGKTVDCSRYPARPGTSDLLQIALDCPPGQPAWTAAVNTEKNYLWFSLRDSALLPSTIFWIENCGRQSAPWKRRNCSLGLEDICGYFDLGSEISRQPNAFSERGIPTVQTFHPQQPFVLPYIQGAVDLPPGFGPVVEADFEPGRLRFGDQNGLHVTIAVDTEFVFGRGKLIELCQAVLRS